jgi:hypothetical protein
LFRKNNRLAINANSTDDINGRENFDKKYPAFI